jgi:hypothetical protein
MRGAIPPLPTYPLMAWCSVKAQGQLYLHSSTQICNMFVFIISFKLINFVLQMFSFLVPKCSTGLTSEVLQIVSTDLAWILQPL